MTVVYCSTRLFLHGIFTIIKVDCTLSWYLENTVLIQNTINSRWCEVRILSAVAKILIKRYKHLNGV